MLTIPVVAGEPVVIILCRCTEGFVTKAEPTEQAA